MSNVAGETARRGAPLRWVVVALLTAVLVTAGLIAPVVAQPAQAADLSKFDAGNIISNSVFFHSTSMSQAQVQAFLVSKEKSCKSGATCLKSYRASTRTISAGQMCNGYKGSSSESASAIIYKVARSCGINPQVLLVMLQKEQGLVTSTKPSSWAYSYAMGANCPDSTGCKGNSAGFFTQMYAAGWQLKRYANPSGTSKYFTWYPIGKVSKIGYSPRTTFEAGSPCGYASVRIANQATANLYYYTPYVPNTAALRAGYGTGDSCSSYGNRNFYNYFTDWFGSTHVQAFTTTPTPTISGTAKSGHTLTAHAGTWSPKPSKISYRWLRNGSAISGATASTYRATNPDVGKTLTVKVTASRTYFASVSKASKATAKVAAAAETFTKAPTPTISGTVKSGQTLTAHVGSWSPKPSKVSYQWLRDGSAITGATGSTYRAKNADAGKTLSVKVTASRSGYKTAAKTSKPTAKVAAPTKAFASAPAPTITGAAKSGQILTAHVGTWSPKPSKVSYQWLRGGSAVSGATGSTYGVTNSDSGKTLSVTVTAVLTGYKAESKTSKTTAEVAAVATTRLSGADAPERSVAASRLAHAGQVSTVYLVGSEAAEDALSVSALASAKNSGMLVVPRTSMPSAVSAELKRLAPASVVLVGAAATLSSGTEARVAKVLPQAKVTRITGADRFVRSLSVTSKFGASSTVFIATGWAFPDAISAAAIAGSRAQALIVVDGTAKAAPAALMSRLKALHTTHVALIGGPLAVSSGIVSSFTKAGMSVTRHSGESMYDTNAALMSAVFTGAAPKAVAMSSASLGEGAVAASLAGALHEPLFLTTQTCISASMGSFLNTRGTTAMTLVGSTSTLNSDVARLKRC